MIIQVGDLLIIPQNTNYWSDKLKSITKAKEDTIIKITTLLGFPERGNERNAYAEIYNLIEGNLTPTGDKVEVRLQSLKLYNQNANISKRVHNSRTIPIHPCHAKPDHRRSLGCPCDFLYFSTPPSRRTFTRKTGYQKTFCRVP